MSPILVLDHDDEEKALEFEPAFLGSLTTQQRFDLVFQRSREMAEIWLRHGYRKPSEIIAAHRKLEDMCALLRLQEAQEQRDADS
jgi:hypothetical protein